jgi:hypothetical protein
MELHKNLTIKIKNPLQKDYILYFKNAYDFVQENYKEDFDRIKNTDFNLLTPRYFFTEYIWVVYVSGFNAKIISKIFPKLLNIYDPLFSTFETYNQNVNSLDISIAAMEVFANKRKVAAIINTAFNSGKIIAEIGWENYKNKYLNSPKDLQFLPFIGEITSQHLARNIGYLNFVKPDIHLERAAKYWGFSSSLELCSAIQKQFPIELGLIDLVLWYSLSTFGSK